MVRFIGALIVALVVLPTALLHAQESDDEWLANCRAGWGGWGARSRHCEIRELGMKAPRGSLSVDPGLNGGVEIVGWNRDSIAISARIQVNARSMDDADAIARDLKIETSGGTIIVTGGSASFGRRQHWGVNLVV